MPAPPRDERRSHRRLVLIGAAGAVVIASALAVFVVAHTDGSDAVEADVSQGPKADLPVDRIIPDGTFWPAGEGPGSNSLDMPDPDATAWPAGEGPGSNSLDMPDPDATAWPAGEGPGSSQAAPRQ